MSSSVPMGVAVGIVPVARVLYLAAATLDLVPTIRIRFRSIRSTDCVAPDAVS